MGGGSERRDQIVLQWILCVKGPSRQRRCGRGGGSVRMTKECYSFLVLLNRAIIRGWRKIGQVVREMAEVSMLPCIARVVVMFGKTRQQPVTRHRTNNQVLWEGEQRAKW